MFHLEVSNDKKGIELFFKQVKSRTTVSFAQSLFCMEHTGIYCNPLLEFLFSKKANIWVENAAQIRQSMGVSRTKNDKTDAVKIAYYAYKNRENVSLWQPKREIIGQLDRLTALRSRLVSAIGMLKKPLKELAAFGSKKEAKINHDACHHSIKALQKDLISVDKQIKQLINSDPQLENLNNIISTVKGISTITATEIIITTNEFKHIQDPKKFACYAGVVPFDRTADAAKFGKMARKGSGK